MSAPPALIGLLEDDASMRFLLRSYLEKSGFRVQASATAEAFFAAFERERPDCLLIDLGLPDEDGLVVVRKIRYHSDLPLFIVSSRHDERDRLAGLELGADDYITKPFHPKELVARLVNQLRRHTHRLASHLPATHSATLQEETIRFAGLTLDPRRRTLTNARQDPIPLTRGEFNALATLLRARGHIVTRAQLTDAVSRRSDPPGERGLDGIICRLRRKLAGEAHGQTLILTVPGHGYRLNDRLLPPPTTA